MELSNLFTELLANKNDQAAEQMSAYMRNQFAHLGISTPLRRKICKKYFKDAKKSLQINWDFVNECWDNPYRELQYVAADYLILMQPILTAKDLPKIKKLALKKPWWDTIDSLDQIVGAIALADSKVNETLLKWSVDKSIWLRRIAIDHQLQRKEQTNTELLAQVISNNFGSDEFFINKAIGWSLREYAKTDPDWVRNFIQENIEQLAPLSSKEASKHL